MSNTGTATEATERAGKNKLALILSDASKTTVHALKTLYALIYIINGVAVGLYAFGFVHPPYGVAAVFGAISIAFSAVTLAILVNAGVKYESSTKRRK